MDEWNALAYLAFSSVTLKKKVLHRWHQSGLHDDVDVERDFYSHLYSGDMTSLESGVVPEDYYNYLESWYRAQKGLNSSSGVPQVSRIQTTFSSSLSVCPCREPLMKGKGQYRWTPH
jgi:hypothetical protein